MHLVTKTTLSARKPKFWKAVDGMWVCDIIGSYRAEGSCLPGRYVLIRKFEIKNFDECRSEFAMCVKEVLVQNQVGLHARPATFFIQKANEFKSSIWVEKEERRVNAKSLLGVLSLGIVGGTSIRIIADGSDEEEAVDSLVSLVQSGFAE